MKNPYELIEEAGLKPEELGEDGLKMLSLYDNAKKLSEDHPKDKSIMESANKSFKIADRTIKNIIKVVQQQRKTASDKEAEDKLKKDVSEMTLKEVRSDMKKLEECDRELVQLKKREKQLTKKKPKTKTRYTKLKEKLLSVTTLIPDNLKNDIDTLKKTEGILLVAHRELVKAWGMNKVTAKSGAKAIEDKFDKMEEQAKESEKKKQ